MKESRIVRYSESFKLEVIKRLETSNLSKTQICLMYGIKGGDTLTKWIRKYGKESLITKIVRVEKPDEKDRLKKLEIENRKLKEALAYAHLKQVTAENLLEVVSEMTGISMEDLKKKLGEK